ncbi:hypothetical protein [Actinobaculum suis]|uniref:hypothetical protein n=1 Tax=Actinobaculum suis TaxID=1657 RepID=UPI000AAC4226|nr:hypothetical protein [Actinobaculum suis]
MFKKLTAHQRSDRNLLLPIHAFFSVVGFVALAALIYYSPGSMLRGKPILVWGLPVNILIVPTGIFLAVAILTLILLFKTAPKTGRQFRVIRVLLVAEFLVSAVYCAGTILNMDRYGVVPTTSEKPNCQVVYSWGNSAMNHRFGRFYLAAGNFQLASKTKYSWASAGAGPVAADAWEIRWDGNTGTLVPKDKIELEPDGALPASFTCSR